MEYELTEGESKQLQTVVTPILIDIEALMQIDGFSDGMMEASFLCGFISALVSSGVPMVDAVSLATNRMILEYNLKTDEVNRTKSINQEP